MVHLHAGSIYPKMGIAWFDYKVGHSDTDMVYDVLFSRQGMDGWSEHDQILKILINPSINPTTHHDGPWDQQTQHRSPE